MDYVTIFLAGVLLGIWGMIALHYKRARNAGSSRADAIALALAQNYKGDASGPH